jgi:hypothetical protein
MLVYIIVSRIEASGIMLTVQIWLGRRGQASPGQALRTSGMAVRQRF